jgi:hypothetical protein
MVHWTLNKKFKFKYKQDDDGPLTPLVPLLLQSFCREKKKEILEKIRFTNATQVFNIMKSINIIVNIVMLF